MVRWVVGSILYGGPIELYLVPTSVPRQVYKSRGMYYPVCGTMHVKEHLLLIDKNGPCGDRGKVRTLCGLSMNTLWVKYEHFVG